MRTRQKSCENGEHDPLALEAEHVVAAAHDEGVLEGPFEEGHVLLGGRERLGAGVDARRGRARAGSRRGSPPRGLGRRCPGQPAPASEAVRRAPCAPRRDDGRGRCGRPAAGWARRAGTAPSRALADRVRSRRAPLPGRLLRGRCARPRARALRRLPAIAASTSTNGTSVSRNRRRALRTSGCGVSCARPTSRTATRLQAGLRASTQLAKKPGCSVRSSASTTGTSSWFCQYSGSSRVFIGDLHEAVPQIERRDVDGPYDRVVTPDVTCEPGPCRSSRRRARSANLFAQLRRIDAPRCIPRSRAATVGARASSERSPPRAATPRHRR